VLLLQSWSDAAIAVIAQVSAALYLLLCLVQQTTLGVNYNNPDLG
jgi:hypothetical protein